MTSSAPVALEVCPGCGLEAPPSSVPVGVYFNTSSGCWAVCGEALAREYSDVLVGRAVHTLSVDAYAAQHAGGPHPDKSVAIHLVGLYLALDRGVPPHRIPQLQKHLADTVRDWPHFDPPVDRGRLHIDTVARTRSPESHVRAVQAWSASVWRAWSAHHAAIEAFAQNSGVTSSGVTGLIEDARRVS